MADTAQGGGRALRMYHILMILALGWGAGRLPDLIEKSRANELHFQQSLGAGAVTNPRKETAAVDQETLATEIAVRVTQETIFRLIEAGWGPREIGPQPAVLPQGAQSVHPQAAREVVVKVVSAENGRSPIIFDLPPGKTISANPSNAPSVDVVDQKQAASTGGNASQPSTRENEAYALAEQGYAALQRGDRRLGAKLLSEAALMDPAAPQAAGWIADVRRLTKRWSIAGYTQTRKESAGLPTAASPVLGGGQTAVAVGYTLDPLAKRPVSVMGRLAAASGTRQGIDSSTAEAALGLRYQPFSGIAVDVERRFALGTFGRNAWSARVSGGMTKSVGVAGAPVQIDAYAEGGAIGLTSPDFYGGAQVRGATPVVTVGKVSVDGGAGVWGAAQQGYGKTISRLDIGPSARFRLDPWPVSAQLDYRFKAAGNANPGSGPVFTVSGEF